MNEIEKLLRKISGKDRERLLEITEKLVKGDKALKFEKIKNTDFYRIRSGKFRIIFHKENGEFVVDGIKMRNECTCENYKKSAQ
jgi:mRNA-degrading endonuclease RelE of RelBE toxin-antitoxin system